MITIYDVVALSEYQDKRRLQSARSVVERTVQRALHLIADPAGTLDRVKAACQTQEVCV